MFSASTCKLKGFYSGYAFNYNKNKQKIYDNYKKKIEDEGQVFDTILDA